MKKRRNDKGFTLVELIVVLVILAILAAILVPALLGYIDKAREKQVTTDAEAAYVAAQALATEYYGKNTTIVITDRNKYVNQADILKLTDIQKTPTQIVIAFKSDDPDEGKETCKVSQFEYTDGAGNIAVWDNSTGNWTVYNQGDGYKQSTSSQKGSGACYIAATAAPYTAPASPTP